VNLKIDIDIGKIRTAIRVGARTEGDGNENN
jgi:hypothetical protein